MSRRADAGCLVPRSGSWSLRTYARCEPLVALLSLEEEIDVVASLAVGDRIAPAALQQHTGVALIDIDPPGLDGLTAAAELAGRLPGCRALILTGPGTPDSLRRALKRGVRVLAQ